jgi:hypothetical protein
MQTVQTNQVLSSKEAKNLLIDDDDDDSQLKTMIIIVIVFSRCVLMGFLFGFQLSQVTISKKSHAI